MRPARRKPVTAAEIEGFLDYVAALMSRTPRDEVDLLLPIWRALERELNNRREADAILLAAKARLTRSMDRTAAQS